VWNIWLALILMLVIVLFSVQNAQFVVFSYLLGSVRLPLALIIICSAIIGALPATLAGVGRRYELLRELANQRNRIKELEEEVRFLKTSAGGEARSFSEEEER